ncbi:MAG: hypothetical protein GYA34_00335 [Chloroflexi bacterium]|nr:hypothetical protein [Chloroflexota bacterium]
MNEIISSIKDDRIVLAHAVNTHKGRQSHHRILLEGETILNWAIESGVEIEFVLTSSKIASAITD